MTTDLDDGADLTAAMERALRDAYPATDPGPAAIAAGRRIQGRRRAALAATGAAVVAAIVVLAVPLVGGATESTVDRTGGVAAADPSPTPDPATPTTADPDDPFDVELPRGWWDMPADQMLAELEDRLPAGVRIVDADPLGEGRNGTGAVDVLIEGPDGTGRLSLMLRPRQLTADEIPDPVTTTDADGNEVTSVMAEGVPYARNIGCRDSYLACEFLENAAGERIGDVSTELDGGTTYHNADLLGPDGGAINLYVADSTGEKPGYEPPSAAAPPLTFAQVRALVLDPIWTSYRP